jgi:hypothetical protein
MVINVLGYKGNRGIGEIREYVNAKNGRQRSLSALIDL